jgi:hypothetical protein
MYWATTGGTANSRELGHESAKRKWIASTTLEEPTKGQKTSASSSKNPLDRSSRSGGPEPGRTLLNDPARPTAARPVLSFSVPCPHDPTRSGLIRDGQSVFVYAPLQPIATAYRRKLLVLIMIQGNEARLL